MWPDKEPSPRFSWKNFSRSTCFAGGGGIKVAGGDTFVSLDGDSGIIGLISGRCDVSLGREAPSNPNGLSSVISSYSGFTWAFPFRILSKIPMSRKNKYNS